MDQQNADTRAASRRLLATSERELQRIVLDMHDGPGQDIVAALSQLQVLERALAKERMTTRGVELIAQDARGSGVAPTKLAISPTRGGGPAKGHRHSGASRQRVSVARRGGAIELTVADEGRGFDPKRVLASEEDVGVEGGHFGLRGIQDRVEMLGGTFALDSAPGRGTALTVTLPLE